MNKVERKRCSNERKFEHWEELPNGRHYWYEVTGKFGYKARYVKEVDNKEVTVKFYQEIYDEYDKLVEIHEKFPVNKGHRAIKRR